MINSSVPWFAAARKGLKQPELLEAWDKRCKGQNSTENKKALLKEFVKAGGGLKKSESLCEGAGQAARSQG